MSQATFNADMGAAYVVQWSRRERALQEWEESTGQRLDTTCTRRLSFHYDESEFSKAKDEQQAISDALISNWDAWVVWDDRSSHYRDLSLMVTGGERPVMAHLDVCSDSATIRLLGAVYGDVQGLEARIEQGFSGLEQTEDDVVPITVSYLSPNGGAATYNSNIACPSWDEIEANYPSPARGRLSELIESDPFSGMGRLMIWNGIPGSGKTFCIRALMRAWKEHFKFVNVVDSDNFLDRMDYYHTLIQESRDKPILFIMEDSAESLLTESRGRFGSRISRMLNMTDGLLTQGRNDLFLVTFNEDIDEIDAAVARPGRCRSRVEFDRFSHDEAVRWLESEGGDPSQVPVEGCTLAQLYQLKAWLPLEDFQDTGETPGFHTNGKVATASQDVID